jgi:hypothetical protein
MHATTLHRSAIACGETRGSWFQEVHKARLVLHSSTYVPASYPLDRKAVQRCGVTIVCLHVLHRCTHCTKCQHLHEKASIHFFRLILLRPRHVLLRSSCLASCLGGVYYIAVRSCWFLPCITPYRVCQISRNSSISRCLFCRCKFVVILPLFGKVTPARRCPLQRCRVSACLCLFSLIGREYDLIYRTMPGGLIGRLLCVGNIMLIIEFVHPVRV